MPAPTFVANYASGYSITNTNYTAALTCAAGDVLVCVASTEDSGLTLTAPTGGTGLIWNLLQSIVVSGYPAMYAWTATASAANTAQTITVTPSGSNCYGGFGIQRWSGSAGIGTSAKTNSTGAPSLTFSTGGANSGLATISADWNASDGAARAYRSINGIIPAPGGTGGSPANNGYELGYDRNAARSTAYRAYYPDAGAAGSITAGLSAPTGQAFAIIAVEVLGTGGAPAAIPYATRPQPAPRDIGEVPWLQKDRRDASIIAAQALSIPRGARRTRWVQPREISRVAWQQRPALTDQSTPAGASADPTLAGTTAARQAPATHVDRRRLPQQVTARSGGNAAQAATLIGAGQVNAWWSADDDTSHLAGNQPRRSDPSLLTPAPVRPEPGQRLAPALRDAGETWWQQHQAVTDQSRHVPAIPDWAEVTRQDFISADAVPWYDTVVPYSGTSSATGTIWTPANVAVSGGQLVLSAIRDTGNNTWTSGAVGLGGAFDGTYGKFECRYRIEAGKGIAYAFLKWPDSGLWPQDGEIDIAEDKGGARTSLLGTSHYVDPATGTNTYTQGTLTGIDLTQPHTVGVEWTPQKLVYTFDGTPWRTVTAPEAVPRKPMYLAFQVEVISSIYPDGVDGTTPDVVRAYIDYFRVSQQELPLTVPGQPGRAEQQNAHLLRRREPAAQRARAFDPSLLDATPAALDPALTATVPAAVARTAVTHRDRRQVLQQRPQAAAITPSVAATLIGTGQTGAWWSDDPATAFIAATTPRRTVPDQPASVPLDPILAAALTQLTARTPATHTERRQAGQQRRAASNGDAPLALTLIGTGALGAWWSIDDTAHFGPAQRTTRADQSTAVVTAPFDPLLAGSPWTRLMPSTHDDRRLYPAQRQAVAAVEDTVVVGTGSMVAWWGADPDTAFIAATQPQRTVPAAAAGILFDPLLAGYGMAAELVAATHAIRRQPLLQAGRYADQSTVGGVAADPVLMAWLTAMTARTWASDRREYPQPYPRLAGPFSLPVDADPVLAGWLPQLAGRWTTDRRFVPQQGHTFAQLAPAAELALIGTGALGAWWSDDTTVNYLAAGLRQYDATQQFTPPPVLADPLLLAHLVQRTARAWASDRRQHPLQRAATIPPPEDTVLVGTGSMVAWWGHDPTVGYLAATLPRPDAAQWTVPAAPQDPLLLAWATSLVSELRAATHADRRLVPAQKQLLSDPGFYPALPDADPLTLAWGAGGSLWATWNRAASHGDRREVPQQPARYVAIPVNANPLHLTAELAKRLNQPATHYARWVLRTWRQALLDVTTEPPPYGTGTTYGGRLPGGRGTGSPLGGGTTYGGRLISYSVIGGEQ